MVRSYPDIMNFLGYCPYQRADTLGQRIMLHRTHRGLSPKGLAKILDVDARLVSRWETGDRWPNKESWGRLLECDTNQWLTAVWPDRQVREEV